jgi:hypothetical protein
MTLRCRGAWVGLTIQRGREAVRCRKKCASKVASGSSIVRRRASSMPSKCWPDDGRIGRSCPTTTRHRRLRRSFQCLTVPPTKPTAPFVGEVARFERSPESEIQLFVDSDDGGERVPEFYSLIGTAKLNELKLTHQPRGTYAQLGFPIKSNYRHVCYVRLNHTRTLSAVGRTDRPVSLLE